MLLLVLVLSLRVCVYVCVATDLLKWKFEFFKILDIKYEFSLHL